MELVVEVIVALLIFAAVLVLVPTVLALWLLRRLLRAAPVTRVLGAVGLGRRRPDGTHPMLGRRWTRLIAEAEAARDRFVGAVDGLVDGPLKHGLLEACDEVDAAVADAGRVAAHGHRAERAHRDVLSALSAQRRTRRRSPSAPADVRSSLDASINAQHSSAQRLSATVAHDLAQLQLIVARLDELTAHALELATSTPPPLVDPVSIADRVAALRMATAELDRTVTA